MVKKEDPPMSAFERRRLANMATNTAILKDISVTAASVLPPKSKAPPKVKAPSSSSSSRTTLRKRTRAETTATRTRELPMRATRQSSRLAGIKPEELEVTGDLVAVAKVEEERAKRARVEGTVEVEGLRGLVRGAQAGVRTFGEEDLEDITDEGVKRLAKVIGGLSLYEKWAPNDIKITPLRVYAMAMHPTPSKPLIFAGDKEGTLGIFDASQDPVKAEVSDNDDDEETIEPPSITTFKAHGRTISSFAFSPTDDPGASSVYTSSYDGTIRRLDLHQEATVSVWASDPSSSSGSYPGDLAISAMELHPADPNLLLFSTLEGLLCRVDIRSPHDMTSWQLSEQKIGGFSLHPVHPHLIATASLDRTMKIWDLRKMVVPSSNDDDNSETPSLLGEHRSRLSVSHAAWSPGGRLATTSYDDTIKLYTFPTAPSWAPGAPLPAASLEPSRVIPHNNQTGRWVSIFKPVWQRRPADGLEKFAVGNMNRFVDVFAADGTQVGQLGGDGISAVPAVCAWHPEQNWVTGGTASGKVCLWM